MPFFLTQQNIYFKISGPSFILSSCHPFPGLNLITPTEYYEPLLLGISLWISSSWVEQLVVHLEIQSMKSWSLSVGINALPRKIYFMLLLFPQCQQKGHHSLAWK